MRYSSTGNFVEFKFLNEVKCIIGERKMSRKTISSSIKAEVIYPAFGSDKSATTEFVNFDLTGEEALSMAKALLEAHTICDKVTVRISRKKNKSGKHVVTLTVCEDDLFIL